MNFTSTWDNIKKAVDTKDWLIDAEQCFALLKSQSVSLYKERVCLLWANRHVVSRSGDIVVGIYLEDDADDDVEVMIRIGGVDIKSLHLFPGQFTYFIESTHCLPIIAIAYSEVYVLASKHLDKMSIVYAFLSDFESRRKMATSTNIFHLHNRKAIIRGHFDFVDDLSSYLENNSYIECPNMLV